MITEKFLHFLQQAEHDPRISSGHISLYASLWYKMQVTDREMIYFFKEELHGLCKLSSPTTFHKALRELHAYGYIKYTPAHNQFLGSLVEFV